MELAEYQCLLYGIDVASNEFRAIKGIHSILAGLLSAEEMYISRVILRTIKFMAYGDGTYTDGKTVANLNSYRNLPSRHGENKHCQEDHALPNRK